MREVADVSAVVGPKSPPAAPNLEPGLGSSPLMRRAGRLSRSERRMAWAMDRARRRHMLAGRGDLLVVSLTPPIDGRCHKVVEAVLPRP